MVLNNYQMINLPDTIKKIGFLGDEHGNLKHIRYIINSYHLTDTVLFLCGDVGLGFQPKWERSIIDYINKKLVITNCYVIGVRGNHDDSSQFQDTELVKANGNPRNWLNVPDYTVVNVCNKNILCVGGATSIDRKYRLANGWGYWENESPIYKPKLEEHIDIIVTHSAPSFCFPQIKSDIVYEYAKYDETLLDDISKERMVFDKIYEDYKDTITDWFYGHYHQSHLEQINGINFRLLNIEEFCEYRSTDNYNIL